LRLAWPCAEKNQQQIRTHKRALTDSARWEHHGLLSQNSEVHPEAKDTHIARRGRGMGDTLRECRPKPQRRRSIHQARSLTLEVRGTGRAQRRQTPQRSPYRRGSAATSALPSANYSLLRTCPVTRLSRNLESLTALDTIGGIYGARLH
jgi:hypothetical protein